MRLGEVVHEFVGYAESRRLAYRVHRLYPAVLFREIEADVHGYHYSFRDV